jgi:hypothetical protein
VRSGEVVAQRPILPVHVDRQQRQTLRLAEGHAARGESNETGRFDCWNHHRLSRKGDDVARGLGRTCDRDERVKMAPAACECEKDAHGVVLSDYLNRSRANATDSSAGGYHPLRAKLSRRLGAEQTWISGDGRTDWRRPATLPWAVPTADGRLP